MALDPNVLQNFQQGSMLGAGLLGYQQGSAAVDAMRKRRQDVEDLKAKRETETRRKGFETLARGLLGSYGDYAKTQEGQQGLFGDLSKAGYGPEAMGLLSNLQTTFPQQKPNEYKPYDGKNGTVLYNQNNPSDVQPMRMGGEQVSPYEKPAKPASERFQLVKNRKGQMESVDVSTGLNSRGQPVDAWTDPAKPDGPKGTDIFSQERQLRTEYLGQTKDFRDVRDAYGRIKASTKTPTPAGDLSLIYNFMKMQDPGSTVRESEFAAAAASGSLGDRWVAAGKKLLNGERLSDAQRSDFLSQSQKLYGAAEFQKKKIQSTYRKTASQYPGLNADRVLLDDDIADQQGGAPDGDPKKALAQQALSDPEASPEEKAQAKKILGMP